jgi:hypothetical protein
VVQTIKNGYKLEFTQKPPRHSIVRSTRLPVQQVQRDTLLNEIVSLESKGAIFRIYPPFEPGFWASFFLAPKKTGDWRPILNLKPLNKFIKPTKFRMETLATVMKAQIGQQWATSLDLKDAYLHVPIHPSHFKWLRFQVAGQAYAFRCLPFGLSTAPRVFTRVVKALGAFLRRNGIHIFQYLDDWLNPADTRSSSTRSWL